MDPIYEPSLKLLWSTPEPRRVIAVAARMTYSARSVETLMEDLTEAEVARSVRAILERRHYSVLRHVVLMFALWGVSRAFSHQLVRHTAGHAYEQRSQHYRTEHDFNIITPHFDPKTTQQYMDLATSAQAFYDQAVARGVQRDDARFGLPNGVETQLVWTANLEALLNFIRARACRVNTPEIMRVAVDVRKVVIGLIPELSRFAGPTCLTQGMCFEGDKFYKECRTPWASPAVLWRPDFPKNVEVIGVGGRKVNLNVTGALQDVEGAVEVNNEDGD